MQMGCGGRESIVGSRGCAEKESGGRKSEVRRAQHQFEHKSPRPSSRGVINYSSAFSKPIPPSGNVIYIF